MNQRTVRIFLSSTFRDFDEERCLLVQQVFPALRARLRERFVELVDIDLRWGISAEEAEQGQVLSICLDEIDQCRPYFIGLLGERYGWVPPHKGYPTQLAESHPWLAEHRGVASVTELEVRYGVLNNPGMRQRALFFFRDPAYAQQRGGEYLYTDEIDRVRQAELKARITCSHLPVFDYEKPQDLAALLEEQLWALLDAEFPAESVPDAYELENLSHSSFAAAKLGPRFVEDPSLRLRLREFLDDGHQRMLVTGPVAMGKSTVLAHWCKTHVTPGTIVHYHSLEAGEGSASIANILRRLFEWIRRVTTCDDAVPEERAALVKGVPEWLARAHAHALRMQARWIIVLDGLDRLRNERDLLWLPTFVPDSVRLIVSCRPGALQNTLKRRGKWNVLELQPMRPESRSALFEGQLAVYKKRLSETQLGTVLRHQLADHPLFLCTLAEELRVFGSFEGLQGHLDELLSCTDVDDLYEKILGRLEANHDLIGVKRALSALCLSQNGLTEQEVLEFSGLRYQARWSAIRLALGDALFYASGRVRPAHAFLRKAVRDRYYSDPENERVQRLELARWFGQRPLDRRRAWEQPAQLALAGAHQELLSQLSDRGIFQLLHRMSGNDRLHRYWADIEATLGVAPADYYERLWPKWQTEMTLDQCLEMSERLYRFLRYCSGVNEFTLRLTQERLLDCKQIYGESDVRYLRQVGVCAQILALHKNQLDHARHLAEQACNGMELIAGKETKDFAGQLLVLAGICLKQRDTEPGIAAVRRSLQLLEALDGPEHPSLIPHLNCLTDLLLVKAGKASKGDDGRLKGNKQLGEGINLQKRSLGILRSSWGLGHLDSAACMIRTGHVFKRCDRLDAAAEAYKRAMNIRLQLLGKAHPLTQSAQRLLERAKISAASH